MKMTTEILCESFFFLLLLPRSIAIARMQTVVIINEDSEPLELQSLSGTTVQFYSSFFTQKTLSANGGNTTINVYYLPRTVGSIKSTITIKTNRGTLNYHVTWHCEHRFLGEFFCSLIQGQWNRNTKSISCTSISWCDCTIEFDLWIFGTLL